MVTIDEFLSDIDKVNEQASEEILKEEQMFISLLLIFSTEKKVKKFDNIEFHYVGPLNHYILPISKTLIAVIRVGPRDRVVVCFYI